MPNSNSRPPANKQRRAGLIRGADGKLRHAGDEHDIGDLWADQRRIKLAEAIEEKKKQAALRELRRQRGLVGLARCYTSEWYAKLMTLLFGVQGPPKLGTKTKASHPQPWRNIVSGVGRTASKLTNTAKRQPRLVTAAVVVVLLIAATLLGMTVIGGTKPSQLKTAATPGTAPKPGALERGTPAYNTVLPGGKTAEALGGWTRISPPDREAVYAYVDNIGGIPISVSQQKLPADFKTSDTNEQVSQLAKDFDAKETVTAASTTAYIGTSAKGPQSVIFNMNDLLILIKSTAPIAKDQWVTYINSLR